jgi:hypothetical protein
MSDRTNRDLETREQSARKRVWTPPTLLPSPAPQDGYAFRYIRTSVAGQADHKNVAAKASEGWEPVRIEDHPELQNFGKGSGNVEIGGLILCKTPTEMVDQRNAYYADITKKQAQAVDANLMRENDPRMPLFSEKHTTTSRSARG